MESANGTLFYDEEAIIKSKSILGTPTALGIVLASYLIFVNFIGPRYMKDRAPYKLKYPMLLYNSCMVMFNVYLIYLFYDAYKDYSYFGFNYFWQYACHPLERQTNPLVINYLEGTYLFYISKMADLLDTVFIILRKKKSQITFLHIFHHSTVLVCVWMTFHVVREEIGAVLGLLNVMVHVVMYSYYFLAALGPSMRKLLWWKRYLTQVQIVQFVMIISIIIRLSTNNCSLDPSFKLMWGSVISLYLALFINFYIHVYDTNKKR